MRGQGRLHHFVESVKGLDRSGKVWFGYGGGVPVDFGGAIVV